MGFKDFCKKLAWKLKHGIIKDNDLESIIKLGRECGVKSRRGGLRAMAQPRRIATPKSVERFYSRITNPGALEMRAKNIQRKQPAFRRMMRTQSIAIATV